MRMLLIKQDTDIQELSRRLLSARLSSDRVDSTLQSLQALNPHADLRTLRAGTVLLVPEAPSFKVSATDPVHGEPFDDFQKLVRAGLNGAAKRLEARNAARAAEQAEVTTMLKTAALKRILETDADLKQQAAEAVKAAKEEQQEADQAEQALAAAGKAALGALAALGKLLG
jgi:hypothetical protein